MQGMITLGCLVALWTYMLSVCYNKSVYLMHFQ